ncbi:hypothetical protein [Paenibacillus validus]|uniref:hypothetical protein n=1 Tax=Paenibacillus validus TaxID=44253 RepID=UPI003D29B901
MIILVVVIAFIGLLFVAHIKSTLESGQSRVSVNKQIERATDEAWEYHLHQALHECDLHVAGSLNPTDYQKLAKQKPFTDLYVNDYLTPIFTWGYVIGQRYSIGQNVSAEEKRVVHDKLDQLAAQLRWEMTSRTGSSQIINLYVSAARNMLHKGIAAGEKQGGYVLVSK